MGDFYVWSRAVRGGGGGPFHWMPYQVREKKKKWKRYPNQGVGAELAGREKGVTIPRNMGKSIQIAMITDSQF